MVERIELRSAPAGYLLVHGAPVHYFEYLLDKRHAKAAFERTDAPLIFVGHTHIAEYYGLEPDGSISHAHMQHGGSIELEPGKRYIIDVGSIGQPRDLNPQASFVFFDDEKRTVEWCATTIRSAKYSRKSSMPNCRTRSPRG